MPALLVERATALARAEAGLALVHARRIAVAGVSALLGTIVACAFAQLGIVLLVTWPVLDARVPLVNLVIALGACVLLSAAGAVFAATTWLGVARQRRSGAAQREVGASQEGVHGPAAAGQPMMPPAARSAVASDRPLGVELAERVSS